MNGVLRCVCVSALKLWAVFLLLYYDREVVATGIAVLLVFDKLCKVSRIREPGASLVPWPLLFPHSD